MVFPSGFGSRGLIFTARQIVEGEFFVVRDPLQVLTASEASIVNAVAFLTTKVSSPQLETLAGSTSSKITQLVS